MEQSNTPCTDGALRNFATSEKANKPSQNIANGCFSVTQILCTQREARLFHHEMFLLKRSKLCEPDLEQTFENGEHSLNLYFASYLLFSKSAHKPPNLCVEMHKQSRGAVFWTNNYYESEENAKIVIWMTWKTGIFSSAVQRNFS